MPVLRINKVNKLLTFKGVFFLMKCLLAQYSTLYFIFFELHSLIIEMISFSQREADQFSQRLPNFKIFPPFIFEACYHLYQGFSFITVSLLLPVIQAVF